MKKVIAIFAMACALSATSFAQNPTTAPRAKETPRSASANTPEGRGRVKAESPMKSEFGLSDDQDTKFRAANKAQKEAMQAIQADQTLDKAAKIAKVKAQRDAYEAQVKGIFTPEQYAKWEAKRSERKEDAKEKMKEHKANMKHDGEKTPAPAKQ